MENTNPPIAAELFEHLQQRLNTDRSSLVAQYQRALRDTLFTSRSELRPAMLGHIAGDEADTLFNFLQHPLPSAASERGEQLCLIGLSEQAILRLGQVTRHFFLAHLENQLAVPALEISDLYHASVLQGFLKRREQTILSEQERIRSALQKTLGRYTVQMEVAASVAAVTTSILDLNQLLASAVELVRERFDLYYVGVFLVDERNELAILRAGTGEAGREMLRDGHRLPLDDASMISWCIKHG